MDDELHSPDEVVRRRRRRRLLIVFIALVVMAVPVVWFGPRAYSRWQQERLIRQGRELVNAGDFNKASLCLREALRFNPGNIEASRSLAELAEKIRTPNAIPLRERVCRLQPESLEDARAWASVALKFNDITQARRALALMKKIKPHGAACYEIEGRIEIASGRLASGAGDLATAVHLDPTSEEFKMELAVAAIQHPSPSVRRKARAQLEAYRRNPEFHLTALRALTTDALTHGVLENALPLARELAEDPGAVLRDRLLRLTVVHRAHDPSFDTLLAQAQERAKPDPQELALLLEWMKSHFLAAPAIEWTKTLPPETISKPPVSVRVAELHLLLGDFEKLEALTANAAWGEGEYLRHAYIAHASLAQGDAENSAKEWSAAVTLAHAHTHRLVALLRATEAWRWDSKQEELLWLLMDRPEQLKWVPQALARICQKQRDTTKLHRVWSKLFELDPEDALAKENWVTLSLLLGRDTERAVKAARELYESRPSDPLAVVIQAFALHTKEQTTVSVALMRMLTPEQLRDPVAALYYGVFLAALHEPDAAKFLALAHEPTLLPEEQQLLAKARRAISGK